MAFRSFASLAAIVLAWGMALPAHLTAQPAPVVIVETDLGAIEIAVDEGAAPRTAANFLWYVDEGLYDEGQFHRTVTMDNQPGDDVKIEVVQASIASAREVDERPAIALERTTATGLLHVDGAVSMARGGPDTATSSFFICIGDQPSLDFGGARNPDGQGFAAFGQVVSGMDVVRRIQQSPADGQQLAPPIHILRAYRK